MACSASLGSGLGHQYAFLRPRLSARYRFSQGTLGDAR